MAEGASFEEAVASLLKTMGADKSEVEIENLGEQRKMFGLGGTYTKIRGRLKQEAVSGETRPKIRAEKVVPTRASAPAPGDAEMAEIGEKAADFLREIIKRMDVSDAKVNVSADKGEITLDITDSNRPFPIGNNGEVLDAIQTLVGIYVGRLHEGKARITVDAGNYREHRIGKLKELAEKAANEATTKGKKVYLGTMKSAERKIIHAALQDNTNVQTKSQGEGDHRQVVVSPATRQGQ
jgi:spoIIIJ-associated protein